MADAQDQDPAQIVAAMAAGDSGPALNAFYQQYGSMVLALLMKMLGSRAEAEEILQEIFVELWRRASEYDHQRGSVVAWVVTIARCRALDALRARTRRHGDRQAEYSEGDILVTERVRPDVLVSSTRWHQALRQAFERLNPEQRAVLELSYFQGMSHGQIADTLGLPVGTVKSRILAGMRCMRTMLPVIHRAMKAS